VSVDEAIEELYRVFERYPLRPWTDACRHCHTDDEERLVHEHPLRQLTPEHLWQFAADSLMTWGEVEDFKHFLPRLFEILAHGGFPNEYPDPETVFGALGRGSWRKWPKEEQDALEGYIEALWIDQLSRLDPSMDVESLIASVATAIDDMQPLLAAWEVLDGAAPAVHYATLLHWNGMRIAMGKPLDIAWLDSRAVQEVQVRTWILKAGPSFKERLEATFLATSDEETLAVLESAIDFLASSGWNG
jgi:hypothetical protein